MKSRRHADWSFLIMRGAEHSVKQFTFKKRSLVAAPVALAAIISGCFIGMKLQAASQIKDLELQLASLAGQYEQSHELYQASLDTHLLTISSLEAQLQAAYEKQAAIDKKLIELTELEKQLEQFMSTYGTHTSLELDRESKQSSFNRDDNSHTERGEPGPYSISKLSYSLVDKEDTTALSSSQQLASYAALHELPIEAISEVVDSFVEVMHYNLNKAGKIKQSVDAYPDRWPSTSKMTTSGFGYRIDPFTKNIRFHAGIDIDGGHGDAILSAGDGEVIEAGYHHSYGHYVVIEHSEQLKTLYGHLSAIEAKKGDTVVKGEKIGKMGSSGRSTGTHLHFQVMLNNQPVSPLKYLIKPNK